MILIEHTCSNLEPFWTFLRLLCFLVAQVREEEGRQEQRGGQRLQSQTGGPERRGAGAHPRQPRRVRDSFAFSQQKAFVVFLFFVFKRRRWSSVIDGSRSPSWSRNNNCSLRRGEQLSLGGGTGRKKNPLSVFEMVFITLMCHSGFFFFTFNRRWFFVLIFFFWPKVKFV